MVPMVPALNAPQIFRGVWKTSLLGHGSIRTVDAGSWSNPCNRCVDQPEAVRVAAIQPEIGGANFVNVSRTAVVREIPRNSYPPILPSRGKSRRCALSACLAQCLRT